MPPSPTCSAGLSGAVWAVPSCVYGALHGVMGDEVQHLLSQVLAEVNVQEMIEAASTPPLLRNRAVRIK